MEKSVSRITKDSKGNEIPKTIHHYSGEELDELHNSDPEYYEKLWSDAELEAINNPENHNKSN